MDRFGCLDSDADGTSDTNDAFPAEATQWADADGDGYGDNADGMTPDACNATAGTSILDLYGCVDTDGDTVSDSNDLWPADDSQWYDTDGDGYGFTRVHVSLVTVDVVTKTVTVAVNGLCWFIRECVCTIARVPAA